MPALTSARVIQARGQPRLSVEDQKAVWLCRPCRLGCSGSALPRRPETGSGGCRSHELTLIQENFENRHFHSPVLTVYILWFAFFLHAF